MRIVELELNNFRNYEKLALNLSPKLNIFIGENASGKTNLLESVYYLGVGKSFKTSKDKELVKWGESSAYLKIVIEKKYRTHTIEMQIDEKGQKKIIINKIPITKIGELIGVLKVVLFSPEEMKFIKETPLERRRFMDISLSQQDKNYYYNLVQYNKILGQRNKLLKDYYGSKGIEKMLEIWDNELSKKAVLIADKREKFLKDLEVIASNKMLELTDGKEDVKLFYETRVNTSSNSPVEEFLQVLKDDREKDLKLTYTSSGVHRDDLRIEVNGVDVRKYGSQGQQRSTALALKLAEIDLFYEKTGESPILLLDDVLSELDKSRREQLIKIASKEQTIITATEYEENVDAEKTVYNVNKGVVSNLSK